MKYLYSIILTLIIIVCITLIGSIIIFSIKGATSLTTVLIIISVVAVASIFILARIDDHLELNKKNS